MEDNELKEYGRDSNDKKYKFSIAQRVMSLPSVMIRDEKFLTPGRHVDNLKKWAGTRKLSGYALSSSGDTDQPESGK